jgi:hypothetical protein
MELIIIIAAAGAVGGLIKSLAEQKGAVALPCIETAQDGTKYVHLGGISIFGDRGGDCCCYSDYANNSSVCRHIIGIHC